MNQVSVSREVDAPPQAVWSLIGDPGAIHRWHPAIVGSTLAPDGTRACVLADGARIVERVTEHDDAAMRYSYRILESPLPIADYAATLSVEPHAGRARVTWQAAFTALADADMLDELLRGIYAAGLDEVARSLAPSQASASR